MGKKYTDLTNSRFGKLVALDYLGKQIWSCQCDCGAIKSIYSSSLVSGRTKSCGCLNKEALKKRMTTHGKSHSKAFGVWAGMLQRCENPKNSYCHYYGARGIGVSREWHVFSSFLRDMGNPEPGFTLERIDNDLGYFKENCRWATKKEQSRNRRSKRLVTFGGETKSLVEWSETLGMRYGTLEARLNAYGWPVDLAFSVPIIKRRKTK